MVYATLAQQDRACAKLGDRPYSIKDCDGNFLTGYVVPKGRAPAGFDLESKTQSIPDTMEMAEILEHVRRGDLEEAIFAKGQDVRIRPRMAGMINWLVDHARYDSFAELTSRPEGEILRVMERSGIASPGMVTMVSDSGAIFSHGGRREVIRALTGDEQAVFDGVRKDIGHLNRIVEREATALGFRREPPPLIVQTKAIGLNFDYRPVLDHFGQADGSALDQAVGAALKRSLRMAADAGPLDTETGKLALGTLDGPANVELKVLSVNKKIGLTRLLEVAMDSSDRPTGFSFSGDDIAKRVDGEAEPGTDYYAAAAVRDLSKRFGIPGLFIHTHHPVGNDLKCMIPDPDKSPSSLGNHYRRVVPDLVFRTPMDTEAFTLRLLTGAGYGRDMIPGTVAKSSPRRLGH